MKTKFSYSKKELAEYSKDPNLIDYFSSGAIFEMMEDNANLSSSNKLLLGIVACESFILIFQLVRKIVKTRKHNDNPRLKKGERK